LALEALSVVELRLDAVRAVLAGRRWPSSPPRSGSRVSQSMPGWAAISARVSRAWPIGRHGPRSCPHQCGQEVERLVLEVPAPVSPLRCHADPGGSAWQAHSPACWAFGPGDRAVGGLGALSRARASRADL